MSHLPKEHKTDSACASGNRLLQNGAQGMGDSTASAAGLKGLLDRFSKSVVDETLMSGFVQSMLVTQTFLRTPRTSLCVEGTSCLSKSLTAFQWYLISFKFGSYLIKLMCMALWKESHSSES